MCAKSRIARWFQTSLIPTKTNDGLRGPRGLIESLAPGSPRPHDTPPSSLDNGVHSKSETPVHESWGVGSKGSDAFSTGDGKGDILCLVEGMGSDEGSFAIFG